MTRADELFDRGARARRAGRTEEARDLFGRALALDPAHRNAAVALAFLLRDEGEGGRATLVLRPLLAAPATPAGELVALADFVADLGATDLALEALLRARHASGGAPAVLLAHGRLLLQAGAFDEARDTFREAFDRDPEAAAAYYQWAQTRRWEGPEGEEARALLSARASRARRPETRACLAFARAKIADDLGRPGEAFPLLRQANGLRRAELPPFDHAFHEEWRRVFAPPPPARVGEEPADDPEETLPRPLFVVGLPRSGTTLLARLLTARAGIGSAGETDLVGRLAGSLAAPGNRAPDLGRALAALDPARRRELARTLRRGLRARAGGAPRRWIVDKNPLNFWYVPLLRAVFPDAPVLWCRRERRDVLLSLYFQNFAHPALDFSYDLGDLRRYIANAEDYAEAWLAGGDPGIFPVVYEDLVRESARTLAPVLHAIGHGEDAPEEAREGSPERFATASAWQARQPLHTRSVGRWRAYAPRLLEAEPALAAFGFGAKREAREEG